VPATSSHIRANCSVKDATSRLVRFQHRNRTAFTLEFDFGFIVREDFELVGGWFVVLLEFQDISVQLPDKLHPLGRPKRLLLEASLTVFLEYPVAIPQLVHTGRLLVGFAFVFGVLKTVVCLPLIGGQQLLDLLLFRLFDRIFLDGRAGAATRQHQ
jgi:hypothetical protein